MDDKQALVQTLQAHLLAQQPLKPTSASPPKQSAAQASHAGREEKPRGSTARERVLPLEEVEASDDSLASLPDIDLQLTSSMFDASAGRGSRELGAQEEHSNEAWGLEGCAPSGLRSGIRLNTVRRASPLQDSAAKASNSSLASASTLFT